MSLLGKSTASKIPLVRPTAAEVSYAIDYPEEWAARAVVPSYLPSEWDNDHRDYVIGVILPSMTKLPSRIRRIAVEAYLAGYELWSDGSSVVPDEWNWKDIWGVMHDYIFWMHHAGLVDAYGRNWSWLETNDAYRTGWIVSGHRMRGWTWWTGLMIGSWPIWNGWLGNQSKGNTNV